MNWDSIFVVVVLVFLCFFFLSFDKKGFILVLIFFPFQYFKKLDYVPRSGLYDAVNCTAHASDLRKYDQRINKLNEYVVVDVAKDKLAEVKLRK